MKKTKNKTFAQRAVEIEKKYPKAKWDPIEKRDMQRELTALMQEQEAVRQSMGLTDESEQFSGGGNISKKDRRQQLLSKDKMTVDLLDDLWTRGDKKVDPNISRYIYKEAFGNEMTPLDSAAIRTPFSGINQFINQDNATGYIWGATPSQQMYNAALKANNMKTSPFVSFQDPFYKSYLSRYKKYQGGGEMPDSLYKSYGYQPVIPPFTQDIAGAILDMKRKNYVEPAGVAIPHTVTPAATPVSKPAPNIGIAPKTDNLVGQGIIYGNRPYTKSNVPYYLDKNTGPYNSGSYSPYMIPGQDKKFKYTTKEDVVAALRMQEDLDMNKGYGPSITPSITPSSATISTGTGTAVNTKPASSAPVPAPAPTTAPTPTVTADEIIRRELGIPMMGRRGTPTFGGVTTPSLGTMSTLSPEKIAELQKLSRQESRKAVRADKWDRFGEYAPYAISGLANIAGNLLLARMAGKNASRINTPMASAEEINMEDEAEMLRRQATTAKNINMVNARNMGVNAGSALANMGAVNSMVDTGLGENLGKVYLGEKQFNASAQNQINAMNASNAARTAIYNAQLRQGARDNQLDYLAGALGTIPGVMKDIRADKSDKEMRGIMSAYYNSMGKNYANVGDLFTKDGFQYVVRSTDKNGKITKYERYKSEVPNSIKSFNPYAYNFKRTKLGGL